jgi:membrane protein
MSAKHIFRSFTELVSIYGTKRIARSAAGLSYFLTLSLFPFLICLSAAADLVRFDDADMQAALSQFIPQNALSVIQDYLTYISSNRSEALLVAGLLVMVTSSSAGFRTLLHSMDDIYDRRSYIGLWGFVLSVICSFVLLFTVYSAILVLVSGRWIFQFLESELPIFRLLIQWNWIRFILLFLLIFGMVYFLYLFTAPRTKPRLPVARSACAAAVALAGVSVLFSWFIGLSSRYSLVYGSLAAIIILMVWLYLCGVILLLGAALNARLLRASEGRYRLKPRAESHAISLLRDPVKGYRHIKSERKAKDRRGDA